MIHDHAILFLMLKNITFGSMSSTKNIPSQLLINFAKIRILIKI